MPTPVKYKAPFIYNAYYHVVCKSVDGILLMNSICDYNIYKEGFKKFTTLFFDVWSYTLLSNHSHHVIKMKSEEAIIKNVNLINVEFRTKSMSAFLFEPKSEIFLDEMIERQMNSFLVSYANYFNSRYNRKGGLFQKPFRRIKIEDDNHLQQAIVYVNANAQKHQLTKDFTKYAHSSFFDYLHNINNWNNHDAVIDFFGGPDKFECIHKEQVAHYYNNKWPSSRLE